MKNSVEYKGYIGTFGIIEDKKSFGGKLLVKDKKVVYSGRSYYEFIESFHKAVDGYIRYKKSRHEENEPQFKGSFNVRLKPELYADALKYAKAHNISLSKLVEIALSEKIYGVKIL